MGGVIVIISWIIRYGWGAIVPLVVLWLIVGLLNAFGWWAVLALATVLAILALVYRGDHAASVIGSIVLLVAVAVVSLVLTVMWLFSTFGWEVVVTAFCLLVMIIKLWSGHSLSSSYTGTPVVRPSWLETRTQFLQEWDPVNLAGRRAWERDDREAAAQYFEQLQGLVARYRESVIPGNEEMEWTLRRVTLPVSSEGAGQWWQAQSILARGRVWLRWRRAHPNVKPDLRNRWLCTRGELDLSGIDLSDADLTGAVLNRTCLVGADLRRARLTGAALVGANLRDALLDGADLCGVDLSGASGVTEAQLRSALGSDSTLLPADLKRPESWVC